MRMPSNLSKTLRTAPVQERSTKRLQAFLDAAAALFGELGYEGTTMTAVAERSGSSIGALYNYFPDKVALAMALITQYGAEMEADWRSLIDQARLLSPEEFADWFMERIRAFAEDRPAYLSLVAAPVKFRRDPKVRRSLRLVVAEAFRARNPNIAEEQAMLYANVVFQMVKGMTAMLVESGPKEKPAILAEFKKVLTLYLGSIFDAA
ncbi:TetR/AcrR family transcriptional regulator [Terriglobus albidus]|uniref:TetR/AcrR family transcriptional regulator n=2 Tax=Terriglobus albidus TaxID=1592106 RepID=A0A5B9E6G4_9BACT|nr:TetR/AcrR family transcriptional regulator [Terriglobus albidus]